MIGASGTKETILRTCALPTKGAFGPQRYRAGTFLASFRSYLLALRAWGSWESQELGVPQQYPATEGARLLESKSLSFPSGSLLNKFLFVY